MDFFQRAPPFLIQLQNILRKYPDGGQILKELIQNADDAKASEVIFVHDEREYVRDALHAKDPRVIRGPSLLVYNNEMFSDRDWEGIQRPGNSIKRKDPNTVGRFGLGFNSVYHMTDYPAIFSGKNIGILDPQESIFHRGGRLWNIEKKDHVSEDLEDQFQPFKGVLEALGLGTWEKTLDSGCFKGTLFCFPLRLGPSEISENVYSAGRVGELFESFMRDANIALLFLRHVTRISLRKIGKDGKMKTLLTVDVSSKELLDTASAGMAIQTVCKVISTKYMDNRVEECEWLVTTSKDQGNLFPELIELSNKLCNIPVLDLAYPLSKQNMDLFGGRLHCILPLPDKEENQTGLPCLINGCFDLTDDRRSLKWPETDQQHDEGAKWNQILVEKVLPLIYTQAVKNGVALVKKSKMTVDEAYGIWPDPKRTAHKSRWHDVVRQIASCLEDERVLQTMDATRWVTASEAVFLIVENVEVHGCLKELLLLLQIPLVDVPGHVFEVLKIAKKAVSNLNIVSPKSVRKLLHTEGWLRFPAKKKLLLLRYVISDGAYNELLNLKLLPLSDGSFTSFQNVESNGVVYIDSKAIPRILLPGLAHRFTPADLPDDLHQFLVNLGKSGTFKNLVCLTKDVVRNKLHEALPQRWHNCPDKVHWHPRDVDNPPVQWILAVWTFLQQDNDILDSFENQPIVPLTLIQEGSKDVLLGRLKRKTILYQKSDDGHTIPEELTVILEKAGCTIIRDKNPWMWHKNLQLFILAPTPNNILQALSTLNLNQVLETFKSAPKEKVKMFCDFLSQAYNFTASELDILNKLPIFCSVRTITSSDSKLVDAKSQFALDYKAVPDTLAFPSIVIKCRDELDKRLLQLMKVQILSAVEVALWVVKAIQNGSYNNHQNEIQNVMFWILRNGYVLFTQNDELKAMCENLCFIPCNGHPQPPSVLYDPKIHTLRVLFESDKFPPVNYHEDSILMSLRMLGLLDSIHKITPEEVLKIAQQLSQAKKVASVLKKAEALIEVCNNTKVLTTFSSHNLKVLCSLSWVPVISETSQTTLSEPKNMRSMGYANIIEFSMPLTDRFVGKAANILGLSDLPPPEKVVENLKEVSLKYKSMDQYSVSRKLHDVYKYIQDHIQQFHGDLLNGVVIWTGNGFSAPHKIVLSYPESLDLSSCVNKVPPDFLTYKSLFAKCGVKTTVPPDDVIGILHKLKDRTDKASSNSGSPKDLRLVISILDWMKVNSVGGTDELPIPVHSDKKGFTLKPLSQTLYCDMEKQYLTSVSSNYVDYAIVHEEISMATARYLNVPLLSTKVLKPEFFDLWGPSEPVTLRIKNILREYSEHVELFKEMIQNADDADATACHFLVDMRQNSETRKRLIDSGMESCHGPALWSYNNSKFTDADFANIIRIGAATKETQVQKIGKFGLGFNTVYHITDVPSVMSGSKVLIFDPNVNHLQKHVPKSNPGMKLDLQNNSELLNIFSDQFQPYSDVFGCKLAQPFYFDGTLIRLPFRTEKEARESEICPQAFVEGQINLFMTDFENSSEILLIFLRNVKEVSLSHLSNGRSPGFQTVKVHLQKETVQKLHVSQGVLLQREQLRVSKQLGMDILDVNCTDLVKISAKKTNTTDKFYVVQSGLGVEKSLENFMQNENLFCLPVAGVALPLKKNPRTGKWTSNLEGFKGIVFCFLPLPVSTGLPFHINGTFSVMSNRKTLWETTAKGEWNKHLLCDAVLVAIITALLQLQTLNQSGDIENYSYHTFWPDVSKVNSRFMEMVKSFYHAVAFGLQSFLPPLFSNGQECCTVKHACFLDLEMFKGETIQQLAKKVFSMLLKKPYLAIDLPDWVKHGFKASNADSELEKNFYSCERFYREIVFENLDRLETKDRNALILYAIDLKNKDLNCILVSKPCIPTTPHGNLQLIKNLVHPTGKVSTLYDPEEGRFPDGVEFLERERLESLHTLGLLKDKLPLQELMVRASQIQKIWKANRSKALKQIVCILELLNDLLKEHGSLEDKTFRDIVFLPAVPPQSNATELEDLTLMKAKDLYHYKHKALVCMTCPALSQKHLENVKLTNKVMSFLGIDRQPSLQVVMSQLQKASEGMNMLNTDMSYHIAKECYSYLNKLLKKDPNYAELVKAQASTFPFVYTDNDFVPVNVVAHTIPFDVSPYLYKLPKAYDSFEILWDSVGICREFSYLSFFSVLEQMAINHQGTPLSQSEFKTVIYLILHCLTKIPDNDLTNSIDRSQVFVPDLNCILRRVDKIFYNDTPWLPYDEELNFCHEQIPRAVVSKFGIQTRKHHTLQKLKVSSLSIWASPFGAREEITTRIKNILRDYSSKKDILKELLQNADDAEATEVHFVLDCRTHATTKVFGLDWHPVQGPALCVYNNKKFSSKDIEGIQQLGIGGKENHLDKTGKFGLGFNSVFHITDCPSFISADTMMCVFDPNLMFLESADEADRGGMFTVNTKFKQTFQDVYDTFLPSKFNLQEGTIFRLPLRMANTVSRSRISNHTSSLDNLRDLCRELNEDANMILFLNHIRKITFSEISGDGDCREIFSVEAKIDEVETKQISVFQQRIRDYVNEGHLSESSPFRISSNVEIKRSSSSKTTRWLIVRQLGTEDLDDFDTLEEISNNLEQTLIPHGSIAACINEPIMGRAFYTLPLPLETGLPVHVNANFIVDAARRNICKEDGDSPKTVWNTFLLSNIIAPLYCYLLECLRETLKSRTFPHFHNFDSCKLFLHHYLSFFPINNDCLPPQWKTVITKVYVTLFEKKLQVIPVYKKYRAEKSVTSSVVVEWSNLGKATITEEPFFIISVLRENLERVLLSINMPLAYGALLFHAFKEAGVNVLELNPQDLCLFLREIPLLPESGSLPAPVSSSIFKNEENCKLLLKFCLEDSPSKCKVDLQGVPLLVTVDGLLHYFDKDEPKMFSYYSKLFPGASNEFLKHWEDDLGEKLAKYDFVRRLDIKSSFCLVKSYLGPMYEMSSKTNSPPLPLPPNTAAWLKDLWQFFRSEVIQQKTNDGELFDEIIAIFNEWAIVPVCFKMSPSEEKNRNVLPPADLKNICYPGDSMTQHLLTLGFPELDLTVFEQYFDQYIKPHMLNTENLELLLEQLSSRKDLKWKSMKATDLDDLLHRILHELPSKQDNALLINKLQLLPLFKTIEGRRQNLIAYQKIYLLETTFDLKPFQLSNLHPSTIYLKHSDLNKRVGQYMKIPLMKDLDLLVNLLSNLSTFDENQLLHILRMVLQLKDGLDFQSKEEQIISLLKPVRLLRDKCGVLREASNFYDHKVELFSILELQEYFIPDDFWKKFDKRNENKLHQFLNCLGMKSSLTETDFIKFATQIEKSAKNNKSSLKSLCIKAKALYKYLLSMDLGKTSGTFAFEVGNIAFVIPLKVCDKLKALHPSFTENVTTVALNGSLLQGNGRDYESLVWTSMPLIDTSVYGKERIQFFEGCGARLAPPIGRVIDNIKNVCKAPCDSKDLQKTRSEVLTVIYEFLQSKGDKINGTALKDVQFILVNDQKDIALPRQVVLNLHKEGTFSPYLYKLPPRLARFSDLFHKVGVEDEPTIFHFANTLSTIYSETLDKTSLHANLTKTVLETTRRLFSLLSESKDTRHISSLHLLAVDGKLYESSSLVFNNCRSPTIVAKLQGVFKFVCTTFMNELLNLYHLESLMKALPEKIRPKMLSDLTRESINVNEENLCSYGDQCPLKLKFEKLFFSSMFRDGLICLLQNQSEGKTTKEEATKYWNRIFGTLEIICCSRLRTVLMYEEKPLDGTQCRKTVYVVKQKENGCQIYFEHGDSIVIRKRIAVIQVLAHEIENLMGHVLTEESSKALVQMLACDHPSEITEVLKEKNLWNGIGTQTTSFLPDPGYKIPSEWHDCLDMSIINTFKVGDYVGYMLPCEEEECYVYAVIVEELDKKSFGSCEMEMYLINIGQEDFIEVSVLDLYQFKRSESQSVNALVVCGDPQPVEQPERKIFSAEDLKKSIDLYLSQIQELPDAERQQAIRRLYLKYHPDKNIGQEELFTEICKYLQQKVKEMYSGKRMSPHGSPSSPSSTNHFRYSGGGSFNCWAKWNSQATNHKYHREHFSRTTRCNYDFWGYHSTPNHPKPQEAERWLRQAICDLKAAEHDVGHGHTEWVFYKVHQAVEKALFAAQYLKEGKIDQDYSIGFLAKTVSTYHSDLQRIPDHVKQMMACGVDKEKTQYPTHHSPPGIPNNRFDPGQEGKVISLAKLVVNKIEGYIRI